MARLSIKDVPCLSCQAKYGSKHVCDMPDYCPCDQQDLHISPFSDRALEKLQQLKEKEERGESPTWSDLIGIAEPNPDLPDCQKYYDEVDSDIQCQKPNHHDGKHRAVVEW